MIGLYLTICVAAFLGLVAILRWDRVSFGLPVAYLALLLINHLPGAYAHLVDQTYLGPDEMVELGMSYTTIGVVCFVIGVGLARLITPRPKLQPLEHRSRFWLFCLFGGWFLIYGVTPLRGIPSLGAAINNGAAVWILGVALAIRYHMQQGNMRAVLVWSTALAVYPVVMLVLGGFLSYGSAAVITALAILAVASRSNWRVLVGIIVATVVALNIFVNYFQSRDEIRRKAWSNSTVAERVDVNLRWIRGFHLLDSDNRADLISLDQRLNQNIFVGLAATRLAGGQVDYLRGESMSDAIISVIPRALWPTKPVYGGSPEIVRRMTGLHLSKNTSWGVGQVMEFQINFGLMGVVLGFLGLGGLLGWLDARAAAAETLGQLQRAMLYFLPGVALLQPIGSLVEMTGSAAAGLAAAFVWRWAWRQWGEPKTETAGAGRSRAWRRPRPAS